MDFTILLLLWLSFACLVTLHVALAFTIGQRLGKPRGWLSLLIFPIAPYFGFLAKARLRSVVWCVLLPAYGVLLFYATR